MNTSICYLSGDGTPKSVNFGDISAGCSGTGEFALNTSVDETLVDGSQIVSQIVTCMMNCVECDITDVSVETPVITSSNNAAVVTVIDALTTHCNNGNRGIIADQSNNA